VLALGRASQLTAVTVKFDYIFYHQLKADTTLHIGLAQSIAPRSLLHTTYKGLLRTVPLHTAPYRQQTGVTRGPNQNAQRSTTIYFFCEVIDIDIE